MSEGVACANPQRHKHARCVQKITRSLVWLEYEAAQTACDGSQRGAEELRLIPKGTRELLMGTEQRSDVVRLEFGSGCHVSMHCKVQRVEARTQGTGYHGSRGQP